MNSKEQTILSLKWTEAEMREVCRQARYYARLDMIERAREILQRSANRPEVKQGDLIILPVTWAK